MFGKKTFKSQGFDSLIAQGLTFGGDIDLVGTLQIDGKLIGAQLIGADGSVHINGDVKVTNVKVKDATICGSLAVNTLTVEGTLAIKSGAQVSASTVIYYRTLVIEPGAVINGTMTNLDNSGTVAAAT